MVGSVLSHDGLQCVRLCSLDVHVRVAVKPITQGGIFVALSGTRTWTSRLHVCVSHCKPKTVYSYYTVRTRSRAVVFQVPDR